MEVPFLSSGALNRAHYALVQKVENAATLQAADHALLEEVESIRRRLAKKMPSPVNTKEYLIILLYCSTAIMTNFQLSHLEFALPHALTLAESGTSLAQRRIGYLFCVTIMPKDHELHLMLVNTLRKDLESNSESRICIALDMLIHSPTPEVIPAVQSRLEDLLAYSSPQVRRRALVAFRILSQLEIGLLGRCLEKVQIRMQDTELYVVDAALSLYGALFQANLISAETILQAGNQVLARTLIRSSVKEDGWLQIKALSILSTAIGKGATDKIENHALTVVLEILNQAAGNDASGHAVLLECFRTLAQFPLASLRAIPKNPIHLVRPLLNSSNPNVQLTALTCLTRLDASLWAGTTEEIPAILSEGEVNTIMGFLHSEERLIRINTLQILALVDPEILSAYLNHLLSSISDLPSGAIVQRERLASRSLEVAAALDKNDGAVYAERVREIITTVEDPNFLEQRRNATQTKGKEPANTSIRPTSSPVMEAPVELVLNYLRTTTTSFRTSFTTQILKTVASGVVCTPTYLLIAAAIACEYGELAKEAPPLDVMSALAAHLKSTSPAIQEALLLSMLRVAGRCDTTPAEVMDVVRDLASHSGRHIRSRCDQFCNLASRLPDLKKIIKRAASSTLPDFLQAIESRTDIYPGPRSPYRSPMPSTRQSIASGSSGSDLGVSFSPRLSSSRLRYDAYDPPRATPKKRGRATSSTSSHSSHSIVSSPRVSQLVHDLEDPFAFGGTTAQPEDPMARTLTAGDLALVGGDTRLSGLSKEDRSPKPPKTPSLVESAVARMDLINLDSPFNTELAEFGDFKSARPDTVVEDDFEAEWAAPGSTSRGWCEEPPEKAARQLENLGLNLKRIQTSSGDGEIRIIISSRNLGGLGSKCAIRLRPGEDNSCLWLFKCDNPHLKARIKDCLQGS